MSGRLRIARAILNLGVEPAFVLGREGRGKWDAHGEAVHRLVFDDPGAYAARLAGLASSAIAHDADLLLLPACTLWHTAKRPLASYFAAMPHGITVVSGTNGTDGEKPSSEGVVLARDGELVDRHLGCVLHSGLLRWSCMTAVSSTIALARDNVIQPSKRNPAPATARTMLLDMGHHQYTGRYMLTLGSVARAVAKRRLRPAIAVLSYWKYRWTEPQSWWVADAGVGWTATRHWLPVPGRDCKDVLDVIDIGDGG